MHPSARPFSEFTTAEEFVEYLYSNGYILLTKKGKATFPEIYPEARLARKMTNPRANYVERFKYAMMEMIKRSEKGRMSAYRMARVLRSDNHPIEFKIAKDQLIAEKKICEEKLITGRRGRPTITYYLFEF